MLNQAQAPSRSPESKRAAVAGLRPFFGYYGGKWRDAVKHYPEPAFETIIEPFAGSAFVGASFGAVSDWRIDLTFALHSIPFSSPIEPATMKPQRIGTIGLRWQPAR